MQKALIIDISAIYDPKCDSHCGLHLVAELAQFLYFLRFSLT